MKKLVSIRSWRFVEQPDGTFRLTGFAFGHPRFHDGELVTTSQVVKQLDGGKVETKNTTYQLDGAYSPEDQHAVAIEEE